jgi:sigma-B regulation protein RsbU (phosphoserine phosphatase)
VPFLEIRTGPRGGERIAIGPGRLVIGRHPACDIVIDASAVSRQHAAITTSGDDSLIDDLRSRNGTLVNGRAVGGPHRLEDGDEIRICDQLFVFGTGARSTAGRVIVGIDTDYSSRAGMVQDVVAEDDDDHVIVSQYDVDEEHSETRLGGNAEAKLRALVGLNKAIGASLSLDEVLPRLLDGLFEIFPRAERGFVLLVDSATSRLLLRARKTRGAGESGPLRLSLSLINKVVESRRAILSADASTDSRFNASQSVVDSRIRSVMCVPVQGSAGQVLGVIHIDSQDLRCGFDEATLEVLAGIAGQAAQAIEQALAHDDRVHREQIKRDLELAHRVQQGLLPSRPPEIPGFEVFDYYEPAQQVGGDFFGYVPLAGDRLAVVLADVSGKGISAALVMAMLSADVRYCLASERDVARAVANINESFLRGGWDDRFATMIVAVLDAGSSRVTVVNAGHLPVFIRDPDGTVRDAGTNRGCLPIGLDPSRGYEASEIDMAAGSTIVFFTDGISEALDHEGQLYGFERLERVMAGPPGAGGDAPEVGRRILADVERHAAGQIRSDDMCIVCISRPAPAPA